ncbi:homing endonuclease associated repeat-containing protein [Haloimpatiens sp. FM7330]|uniref:homing endonuclease associated repeat-containing protein n=1 Tax=Haloimpatiens sp. FM7330 TaxID=3298610 RepID=UPI003638AA42
MTNDELLELIKNEYYRIKPKGCWDFMKKRDKRIPCLSKLKERFGKTYNQILIMSGISDDELNFVRRNKEQYLEKLKQISMELGYVPSHQEFLKMGYSPSILKKYYGSYLNAVRELGINFNLSETPIIVKESKEELLDMYIRFSESLGGPASCNDLEKSKRIYNAGVFRIRFGGMKGLKKSAGFEPIYKNNEKYTKEYIKNMLRKLYIENNRRLTAKEMAEDSDLPSLVTVLTKFKTTKISDIWQEIENDMDCV